MKNTTLMLATVLVCALVPAAAIADTAREDVSRTVTFQDLDLANPSGRARLDRRLDAAVRRACGTETGRVLSERANVVRCRREALASAATGRTLALADSTRRTGMAMMTVDAKRLGN